MSEARGHVALTGASGGIGRALARELASRGYAITLVGRRRRLLEDLAREIGRPSHIAEADLSRVETATSWIPDAEAALGPIDMLVSCAGAVLVGRFGEVGGAEVQAVLELDLLVPLLLARAVLPGMLARGRGVIVNVASTGALAPNPGMVHYCAAKGGLAAASEALRGELHGTGVDVVTVYPGPIPTAMLHTAYAGYPDLRRVRGLPSGKPDELARRVCRAIERRRQRVIYPRIYVLFRYLPWLARRLVDHFSPPPLARGQLAEKRP